MGDRSREALHRDLALARQLVANLEAELASLGGPPPTEASGDLVPVKVAAQAWGLTENAALKRARKGLGHKRPDGRWYFTRATVDAGRVQDAARQIQDAAR